MSRNSLLLAALCLSLVACKKDHEVDTTSGNTTTPTTLDALAPVLPATLFPYSTADYPQHYDGDLVDQQDNTPADNPITDAGATLGRVLFYDVQLSANRSLSCASCHVQENGFTDPNTFSIGFEGGLTGRNSMGLSNARYYENGHFFWDERAETLEDQVLMPIQDEVEMGMSLTALIARLDSIDYYPELFTDAFGDPTINTDRVSKALAQFVRTLVSYESKFDEALGSIQGVPAADEVFPNFTDQENAGFALFNDNGCAACHGTPAHTGGAAVNNGLDATTTDLGLAGVTGLATDEGKMKVPSLRNIAVTGPFMHDGRFETLLDVVEHYNSGVQNHPNLDPRLRQGPNLPQQLNLTEDEKLALVAFLGTLTDETFLTAEQFSNPFPQ